MQGNHDLAGVDCRCECDQAIACCDDSLNLVRQRCAASTERSNVLTLGVSPRITVTPTHQADKKKCQHRSVEPGDHSRTQESRPSQTPGEAVLHRRKYMHRRHSVVENPKEIVMNEVKQDICRCTACPGQSCGCGCQKAVEQKVCACGPQCQCGVSCACAPQ